MNWLWRIVNEVCFCPNMVTLKVEEVLFKSPVKENNLIKIYGDIVRIGNKSIKIAVEARKFNVYSHEETVVTTTKHGVCADRRGRKFTAHRPARAETSTRKS